MKSLLKATAAVTFLAAAAVAASSYISAPLSAGFFSSPLLLWVAANVIIIWLLLSSRRGGRTSTAAAASSAGHAADVIHMVDSLYPSSEYEGVAAEVPRGEASVSKRQAREARTAARRADRPGRLRKKSASEGEPSPRAVEEVPGTVAAGDDDADVSIDSLWHSIVQRRAARPVAVRKSETWASDELPRLQRAAEKAVARREMRKSVSAARAPPPPSPPQAAPPAARQLGWRTREVLVVPPQDDLMRRVESLIRRHHEDLSLQRQESEQRQTMELHRRRPTHALIRV